MKSLKKPVDKGYYKQLKVMLEHSSDCAIQLRDLMKTVDRIHERVERIDASESEADHLLHVFTRSLTAENVKAKKKEKLIHLANLIDDLTDSIEQVANKFEMLCMKETEPGILEMCDLICKSSFLLVEAAEDFPLKTDRLIRTVIDVNRMEEAGDRIYHAEIRKLFSAAEPDALHIMKYKELYEGLENIMDRCEDIADIFDATSKVGE